MSAVSPTSVFRDREMVVVIGGDDTRWEPGDVEVDFGDDIEVVELVVSSPTSLHATLYVAGEAALGVRTVTVTAGDDVLSYADAFSVSAAVIAAPIDPLPQGGIGRVNVTMADASTPFDLTSDANGFLHLGASGEGLRFVVEDASLFELQGLALVDVLAETGSHPLTITSGAGETAVESTLDAPIEIAARAPAALEDGAIGALEPWSTQLYRYDPPAAATLVTITLDSSSDGGAPAFALLPASGSFADLLDFDSSTSFLTDASGDPYYLVVFDNTGAGGYDVEVAVDEAAAPAALETEVNDACATATPLASGDALLAELSSATDVDFFQLTAGPADIGRVVHVVTSPGEPSTDTLVEVFASDCTTTMGGPSFDGDYHEDHRSTPISVAGPVFVKVTRSSFTSPGEAYVLVATFEDL